MRVLLVATAVGWSGGIQRYGASIQDALVSDGNEVKIVQSSASRNALTKTARLTAAVMDEAGSADLVWVLHPRLSPVTLPLARLAHLPVVVSTYGFENWGRYPYTWREALRRAGVVTAISKYSISMMGEPGRRAVLLPPTWGVAQPPEQALPGQSERKTISFVGRLQDGYKGLDTFVELSSRFRGEPWKFEAAGARTTPEFAVAHSPDNLRMTANASDTYLAGLYRRSAVVVVPSRVMRTRTNRFTGGEGFGIVSLEAALAGAVTIVSDEGACPETVAVLGNGMACSPTADAIEVLLRSLLADEHWREVLAVTGVRRSELFSAERFRARVRSVLRRAAAA